MQSNGNRGIKKNLRRRFAIRADILQELNRLAKLKPNNNQQEITFITNSFIDVCAVSTTKMALLLHSL